MTSVAIDGPAAAGKSTVARLTARTLGITYLDTGAMYRAVTLAALLGDVSVDDGAGLAALATDVGMIGERVTIRGEDVSERIRHPDVTAAVSRVSAHPEVRHALVEMQRALAAGNPVVMEGRDIGSTVLPDAEVKIFLTASLRERARRRWAELDAATNAPGLSELERAIAERDRSDSERANSPLTRPPEAIEIDTTGRTIAEVVDQIVAIVRGVGADG